MNANLETDLNANVARYAAFLPDRLRTKSVPPRSSWMPWRGGRIHIVRAGDSAAPVRGILVHGGGGYSAALWPLVGVALRRAADVEVLAPDLPLYGYTEVPDRSGVRYPDWIDLLCDIIIAERRVDDRPIVLFGASMGGMLAYEAAARTRAVAAVLATCLLDTTDPAARTAAARFPLLGRHGHRVLRALDPLLGSVPVGIRWLADMTAMSANRELSRLCAADPRGGGTRVPIGFLSSWLNFAHTAPEDYAGPPVTLVHPAADTWTPPELSARFLQRISAPTQLVLLDNCGHYPIEEPGLTQLERVGRNTVTQLAEPAG